MKTFVTGATGFVGAAIARALLDAGHEVRVLVRPTSDLRNITDLDVERIEGDLRAPAAFAPALKGVDALFHAAADYRLWVPDPAAMFAANVDGTRALLRAAAEAGVARIVYTSTVAALGIDPSGAPADETTPVLQAQMIGPYKQSKYQAQQEVLRLAREDGVPVVIVNPSAPVGPRDVKPTPTGQMIVQAVRGKMPAYVDTGLNVVHVDDVARGHLLAHEHGVVGERYILGGENMSLRAIFEAIAEIVGGPPPRLRMPHAVAIAAGHVAETWARLTGGEPFVTVTGAKLARKRMYFDTGKARRDLGYAPRSAREALAEAVAWFRQAGYIKP